VGYARQRVDPIAYMNSAHLDQKCYLHLASWSALEKPNCRRRGRMKYVVLSSVLALGVALAPLAMAEENATDHHYVKDSVITTKVKAKLAEKHLTTLTKIRVDTDENGVVWLSGRAPTQDARDLAGLIAKNTDGVNAVHNDIAVQPD
jgi:hyperosmotically inducible protein